MARVDIQNIIRKAALRYGVDPDALVRIAEIESGLDPSARNPNSSAKGLFQFIDTTAREYGLDNPLDAAASADAGARFAKANQQALASKLGRVPSGAELYLAHQQGAGGALKLLQNANSPVESVIGGDEARLNASQQGQTAGDFASQWLNKYEGGTPPTSAAETEQTPMSPDLNAALLKAYQSADVPLTTSPQEDLLAALTASYAQPQQLQPNRRKALQSAQNSVQLMPANQVRYI